MKNLVKVSIFALALGFFASCTETAETPAPETTPATEVAAPATMDSAAATTAPATTEATTAPATTDSAAH
jgi:hypothetical protein